MSTFRILLAVAALTVIAFAFPLIGCEKQPEPPAPAPAASSNANHDDHDQMPGDDHGHGATTQLGEQSAGGFVVKASRDGDITPGSDAAIDAWITGGSAKIAAVRFWIGAPDAKGSIKAKAELEKENWHTHAEVPKPLPAGSELWIEIQTEPGDRVTVGFDLKN